MRNWTIPIAFLLATGCASAQSLKPEDPAPLKAGINKGTVDNFVGTQYWYFFAGPGDVRVVARFKSIGPLGAPLRTPLTVTLYDERRTWHSSKVLTSENDAVEGTFTAKGLDKKLKTIISVAPPSEQLVRSGGDYELEATGAVQFEEAKVTRDPIIRTFAGRMNNYGATKFLADGTVEASDGSSGTWKAFDAENRVYTVVIGGTRFSLQYLPGRGLVETGGTFIVFQELR